MGTVASGANVNTAAIGYHTFTVTAIDKAGNVTTQSVEYVVNSTARDLTAGANVPATLALSLGTAPHVRQLHAGRRRDLHREHDRQRDLDRR